ncbi:hypothetical protein FKP32DRAFT_393495 [Trametes sanguinea]|nr:hypothetical protein FKP32DRAFT_393495 [Trametes sanguinea]
MQSTPVQTPTASTPQPSVLTTQPGLTGANNEASGARPSPISVTPSQNQPSGPPWSSSGSKFPSITIPHTQPQRTVSTPVLLPKRPLPLNEPVRTASADQASPSAPPNAAASSEQPARPKAKKRKTVAVDFDFIAADLDWYQHTRASDAVASPQNSANDGSSGEVSAPSASAKQEPGVNSTPETQGVGRSAAPEMPAPAAPAVAAPITSAEATVESKSRSPSVPLRDVVTSPSTEKNDKPVDTNNHASAQSAEALPQSPVILGPSLTRRPSQPSIADTPAGVAGPSVDAPPKAPSPSALPSPLTSKKPKKKKKKGPPGLKFLPILTPSGETMVESPAVEEPSEEGMVTAEARDENEAETFGSAPLLASEPPVSSKDPPPEERRSASSAPSRKGTPLFFDSPTAMDVDEAKPPAAIDSASVEELRASGNVAMHDAPTLANPAGGPHEYSATVVQQPPLRPSSPTPSHPTEASPSGIVSASEPVVSVPTNVSGVPPSAVAPRWNPLRCRLLIGLLLSVVLNPY